MLAVRAAGRSNARGVSGRFRPLPAASGVDMGNGEGFRFGSGIPLGCSRLCTETFETSLDPPFAENGNHPLEPWVRCMYCHRRRLGELIVGGSFAGTVSIGLVATAQPSERGSPAADRGRRAPQGDPEALPIRERDEPRRVRPHDHAGSASKSAQVVLSARKFTVAEVCS